MEIIKDNVSISPYDSRIFNYYFEGLKICVADVETDGLNPLYNKVILGGILSYGNACTTVTQYFSENRKDEGKLLKAYGNALIEADVVISYNGESFDLPFLKERFKKHDIHIDLDSLQSFDLYRALNLYSNFRDVLPNLKQKTIEGFLGLSDLRDDEISGRESVKLYRKYLTDGSKDAKKKILLHNRDDLIQLSSVLRVLDKLDLHRILFHEGFTLWEGDKKIIIGKIVFKKKTLEIKAKTRNITLDYYSFDMEFQAVHKAAVAELSLSIPFDSRYGADYIDLMAFTADYTDLKEHSAYESGFLIIRQNKKINYGEINKAIKILLENLLNKM